MFAGVYYYTVEWVEIRKTSEAFWVELYCKMSHLFCKFLLTWDFLLEILKLKDKLQIWDFESVIFWSKFFFFVTASVILKFFFIGQPWWPTFVLSTPSSHRHKKASYSPETMNNDFIQLQAEELNDINYFSRESKF